LSKKSVREKIRPRKVKWDTIPVRDDLKLDQIFIHRISDPQALRENYQHNGWDTEVVLQSPSHDGPTTAKPIGFPFNFVPFARDFSRWGPSVVLRLHVDIVRNYGKLVSWPHLEPDPRYEPEKHVEMYLAKNEIRGEAVIDVFGQFYRD
jgi:hypothetical protein